MCPQLSKDTHSLEHNKAQQHRCGSGFSYR